MIDVINMIWLWVCLAPSLLGLAIILIKIGKQSTFNSLKSRRHSFDYDKLPFLDKDTGFCSEHKVYTKHILTEDGWECTGIVDEHEDYLSERGLGGLKD